LESTSADITRDHVAAFNGPGVMRITRDRERIARMTVVFG
jgi:hypothetical protein